MSSGALVKVKRSAACNLLGKRLFFPACQTHDGSSSIFGANTYTQYSFKFDSKLPCLSVLSPFQHFRARPIGHAFLIWTLTIPLFGKCKALWEEQSVLKTLVSPWGERSSLCLPRSEPFTIQRLYPTLRCFQMSDFISCICVQSSINNLSELVYILVQ